MSEGEYIGLRRSPTPQPYKRRRWWQFWLAKPRQYILDAQTGRFMGVPAPQDYWSWLFSRDTWFKVRS